MRCCVCGNTVGAAYCRLCGHTFCSGHRTLWSVQGVWQRGVAAVREWIGLNGGTPFCDGHEE